MLLCLEIFTYLSGWDGSLLYNEVYVSSDAMVTWTRVRSNWGDGLPPWPARDAANAEMTASGVIVIIGGTSATETLSAAAATAPAGCADRSTSDVLLAVSLSAAQE